MFSAITLDQNQSSSLTCNVCGHQHLISKRNLRECLICGEKFSFIKTVSDVMLFSPMQVAVVAFVGGWLAGFILLALNYLRMKRFASAMMTLVAGVTVMAGWIALVITVPVIAYIPGVILWLVTMVAMLSIAKMLQGREYNQHIETGGAEATGWKTFGYMLLSIIPSIILGVVLILTFS